MLKPFVAKALVELVTPIQAAYEASEEWKEVTLKAYPPPPKKEAKPKNRGTFYPGKKIDVPVLPSRKPETQAD